ncbi:MAG: exodeoxyribonuclease VII small subunit [Eggerthellaceae bacterium]|nr:exodeoxyribonuclease VII small subunit [Eggerthellaceae bacterium]
MENTPRPIDDMMFREAMDELDGIVRMLESSTMELEDSLKAYERGVALIADLQKRLADAEQKVDMLMGELSGEQDDAVRDTTLS